MTDPRIPDYYAMLGVPETASDEEIARAYRRLARQLHPDANPEADAARFQDATAAYDVIGDRARRGAYDASRRPGAEAHRGTAIPVHHGAGGRRRAVAAPTAHELVLSFEQAVLGATAKVQVDEEDRCPRCAGSGRESSQPAVCPDCGGSGSSARQSGQLTIRYECARCGGAGRLPPPRCPTCAGGGLVARSHAVTVRIPPGVEDGSRVRIPLRRDGPPAEALYATVRVRPHPHFTRTGRDVAVRVPVTLAEAALGAEIRVPTVDGRGVALIVPPGTDHGSTFRVAGAGVPHRSDPGDLLVTVNIDVPASLSEAQRRALEAYGEATPSPRNRFWPPTG